jgi:hypothetical protein
VFRSAKTNVVWLLVYVVMMIGIMAGTLSLRERVLDTFDNAQERENWQEWREDASEEGGPVQRRALTTDEPQLLLLARDHPGFSMVLAFFFSSALFLCVMFAIRGVMAGSQIAEDSDPDPPTDAKP